MSFQDDRSCIMNEIPGYTRPFISTSSYDEIVDKLAYLSSRHPLPSPDQFSNFSPKIS